MQKMCYQSNIEVNAMYKIAILGCENSHANNFLDFIIKEKKYPDIQVVGVYSDDAEAQQKLCDEYGVYGASSYDEFVGQLDGLIITARHGANHYKYAKPYLNDGIPMFIDKPITITEEDANEFARELKKRNIRVSGGSSCIYAALVQELKEMIKDENNGGVLGGYLRAPINPSNPYGDFFFYAQHLVEVMCEIYGYYPEKVRAEQMDSVIYCTVTYDKFQVNLTYTAQVYTYGAVLSMEHKLYGGPYTLDGCFQKEFEAFYGLLKGDEQEKSYEDFIAPVFIMNAINRSLQSGQEERVNRMEELS